MLGTFAAAAADTPAALPLAAGVLELLRAPAVHGHPQVRDWCDMGDAAGIMPCPALISLTHDALQVVEDASAPVAAGRLVWLMLRGILLHVAACSAFRSNSVIDEADSPSFWCLCNTATGPKEQQFVSIMSPVTQVSEGF